MSDRSDWLTQEVFRKLAHDIVGHAGVTKGALRELEITLGEPVNEQQAMLLAMSRRGVAKLERLARRLRLASLADRPDPAGASLDRRDLRDIVKNAVEEATQLDARRVIALVYEPPAQALWVRADPELLRVAIAELVSNALRFARQRVSVGVAAREGRIEVRVDDDGPGFPPTFVEQLSPPLRARDGQKGAGISMAAALSIAATHGGGLEIELATEASPGGHVVLWLTPLP